MEPIVVRWLIAVALPLGGWLIGWPVRKLLFGRLASLFAKTSSHVDDIVFEAIRGHVPLWFFLIGLVTGTRIAPIPERIVSLLDRGAVALFIVSMTLVVSRVAIRLIVHYGETSGAPIPTTGLTQGLVKGVVALLGALMVLSSVGVAIGPLLGALGVGSLAVALALQPTLSNLVAGMLLTASRKVRYGDFVELDSGQSGFVEDIGWRATHIRETTNNLVIIPNSKLADSIVRNHNLPEREELISLSLGVAYGSDLAKVERVALEVGREVLRTADGGVASHEPPFRYTAFGESAIQFSVVLRAREFADRPLLVHEFIKRLHARFAAEGIEIPFPQRDLRVRGVVPVAMRDAAG